jgi:hydroxyacylglutathione hydrolase
MDIKQIPMGPIGANCYLILDGAGHGAVVDPGGAEALGHIKALGITVDAILLTHAHYDHTGGVPALRAALGCTVYLHPGDRVKLGDQLMPDIGPTADYDDGDKIKAGGLEIEVIHTPGHTPGGVTLKAGDALFTGDTLFRGSMGRTDLPGGSYEVIMNSLKKLGALEGDYRVFSGHDAATTLAHERCGNYYLMEAMSN